MTTEAQHQPSLGAVRKRPNGFIEKEITALKNRLEERLTEFPGQSQWEGMIEDCEIILSHFEKDAIPEDAPSEAPSHALSL